MTNLNVGAIVTVQYGNVQDTNGATVAPSNILGVYKDVLDSKFYLVRSGDQVGLAYPNLEFDTDAVLICTNSFMVDDSAMSWVSIKTVADATKYWGLEYPQVA